MKRIKVSTLKDPELRASPKSTEGSCAAINGKISAHKQMGTASFVLLEDDILAAKELSQGLVESGFKHLGSFVSGEELLKVIDVLRPDILLVDITLAGVLDGIQTVAKLEADLPSRVIFLTGDNDEDTLRRAMVLRPHAYLLKPLEASDVQASILTTLSRNQEFESVLNSELRAELQALPRSEIESRDPYKIMLSFPQFAPLGEELLAKLTGRSVIREGKASTFLMQQGELATTTFLMITGMAMCSRQEIDGRELTVHVASPGDPVGLLLALDPFHKAVSVRLPFDARYIAIPTSDVQLIINTYPIFAKRLLHQAASFAGELCELALSLAYTKVEMRILRILIKLVKSIGRPVGHSGVGPGSSDGTVRIFLTRKELADLSGTTVESAIRATKIWERRGILDLSRPGIIVIPSLKRLSEGSQGESEGDDE